MTTIVLLTLSTTFMTIAWYGHLKFPKAPLLATILVSWLIALPEYSLQVPANRIGNGTFTTAQLKIIAEVLSLTVFLIFNLVYFHIWPTWKTGVAFLLILGAAALVAQETASHAGHP